MVCLRYCPPPHSAHPTAADLTVAFPTQSLSFPSPHYLYQHESSGQNVSTAEITVWHTASTEKYFWRLLILKASRSGGLEGGSLRKSYKQVRTPKESGWSASARWRRGRHARKTHSASKRHSSVAFMLDLYSKGREGSRPLDSWEASCPFWLLPLPC